MSKRSRAILVNLFAGLVFLSLAACNTQPTPPPPAPTAPPVQAPSPTAPAAAVPTATVIPQVTAIAPTAATQVSTATQESVPTQPSTATQASNATQAPTAVQSPSETQAPQSPTLAASPTALPPAPTQPATSNQPTIFDKAQLVDKANVEDQRMNPGHSFTMSWTWKNVAHTTWSSDYSLVFYGGDLLGAKTKIDFPGNVNPGETLELSVDMKVPDNATTRSYHSFWALKNANGDIFNFVELTIQVK